MKKQQRTDQTIDACEITVSLPNLSIALSVHAHAG